MAPKAPVATPPRFGTSAIVLNAEGKILTGQRFGSHGAASWQLPGGHLEDKEGLLRCAARETKEETGLDVEARRVVATTYDAFEKEGKHYVTWFVFCELKDPDAVPKAMEPAKCPAWFWKTAEELKSLDLFLPLVNLFKQRPSLDDIVRGSAPLIRLRRDERHDAPHTDVVSIRWDAAPFFLAAADEEAHESVQEPRYYALQEGGLALSRGADLVPGPCEIADYEYPLEVLVADPDDNSKTVAWPLGDGSGVVVPPESHGWERGHAESIELRHIVARLPRDRGV
ncbi:Nudix hydrolase 1 [Tolypocladium ophioglossoides CBS 100239]|uniref:Nudix hydrolase 1 n=1 Tax=Tolypocladium ophioglossoides (strain CBS 100239) TaxID=1163406 RepID=A0A0L0N0G5_TOLOC|nr:Nudix hydrolase 1 [Tolypocladium ophioglossoides CBS 100239]